MIWMSPIFDRAKVDYAYKAERDFKRGQYDKNVNQYIRRTAEKLMDEAEAMYMGRSVEMLVEGYARMAEADERELAFAGDREKAFCSSKRERSPDG